MVSLVKNRKRFVLFNILSLLLFFTSAQAFAWTKSANFESGSVGSLAQGASGFDYAGSATTFSSVKSANGSKSAKMSWTAGNEGWNLTHGEILFPSNIGEGGEVWSRGYYYFQSPWSWKGAAGQTTFIKGLRISVHGQGRHGFVFTDNGNIVSSNEVAAVQVNTGVAVNMDAWNCLEVYVKLSSGRGILRIWKNGILIHEDTSSRTINSGGVASDTIIMSTWNNGVPQSQTEYVDEFIHTTDRPSQVDSKGNYMIGPVNNGTITVSLPPPTRLRVN